MRLFDRALKFLEVQDPKQTKINKLFFSVIALWIGISFFVNVVSQFTYYFITLPKYEQTQSMVLWWIPDIPDLSSGVATLLFWIATTIVGALVTALIYVYKQQMDFQKAMLPLLSEIKTLLLLK